jgi:hypothetical protein
MGQHIITKKQYLKVIQYFHWAKREHYQLWFYGNLMRHKRTEVMLPRLVSQGKLRFMRYGNRLIYAAPRTMKNFKPHFAKVEHGLACTECLVRIYRSNTDCQVISEKEFVRIGIKPEWGIYYPNGTSLMFEFCTRDNFERSGLIKNKILRYQNLPDGLVLFVADVDRGDISNYVFKNMPGERFYFCDYATFLKVPIGEQLTAPIYIWGANGHSYPLKDETCSI